MTGIWQDNMYNRRPAGGAIRNAGLNKGAFMKKVSFSARLWQNMKSIKGFIS